MLSFTKTLWREFPLLITIFTILLLLIIWCSIPAFAEQFNYTQSLTEWTQKVYPKEGVSHKVKEVVDLKQMVEAKLGGELAFWVEVTHTDQVENYVVIFEKGKVTTWKKFNPGEQQQEEGESCSPEEHEIHHGKDA